MSRYPFWAVLAPSEPSWMKKRAFAALELDEGEEDQEGPPFEISLGSGRYHAILGLDEWCVGGELKIAKSLSLDVDEPVYSIERANDPWAVISWRRGALEVMEVDPDTLAKSLGCPLPERTKSSDSPKRKPLRSVALMEGVRAQQAHHVLEEIEGEPLPQGRYRLVDTPRGLLVASGTVDIGFADITLSERLPHATVYAVIASPSLDLFFVTVRRGGVGVEEFKLPPDEFPDLPVASDIKGERTPERILAALGIPAEWFLND
ncbi:hypothetical protein [Archangium sp.]|uniref:hypothetical protein n=1 Tax=Archangium sp. TaxID=1872627 RepID=UPI00286C3204|nr:hypothetical protein [Archangium sp.]